MIWMRTRRRTSDWQAANRVSGSSAMTAHLHASPPRLFRQSDWTSAIPEIVRNRRLWNRASDRAPLPTRQGGRQARDCRGRPAAREIRPIAPRAGPWAVAPRPFPMRTRCGPGAKHRVWVRGAQIRVDSSPGAGMRVRSPRVTQRERQN